MSTGEWFTLGTVFVFSCFGLGVFAAIVSAVLNQKVFQFIALLLLALAIALPTWDSINVSLIITFGLACSLVIIVTRGISHSLLSSRIFHVVQALDDDVPDKLFALQQKGYSKKTIQTYLAKS